MIIVDGRPMSHTYFHATEYWKRHEAVAAAEYDGNIATSMYVAGANFDKDSNGTLIVETEGRMIQT